MTPLKDRIVGHEDVSPQELVVNPANWRSHPSHQKRFLDGVLDQVGWVSEVMVNKRTGLIVDGHLRVALAISRGEAAVPVRYVDLSKEEEALVLATLDPLGSMATTDQDKLDDLLLETQADNESVAALLEMLASKSDDELPVPSGSRETFTQEWGVVVVCSTQEEQNEVLSRLQGEGLVCRTAAA